jgi:PAS domain S-box-containing protein
LLAGVLERNDWHRLQLHVVAAEGGGKITRVRARSPDRADQLLAKFTSRREINGGTSILVIEVDTYPSIAALNVPGAALVMSAILLLAQMLGYETAADVLHKCSILELLATEEHERARSYYALKHDNSQPAQMEWEERRADGSEITVVNAVRKVRWRGFDAIQTTTVDITERKRASEN